MVRIYLLFAGFIIGGTVIAVAITAQAEVDSAQRCAAEGGVLVESGESFAGAHCIDESAVIW